MTTTTEAPATRSQIDYIKDLIDQKQVAGKAQLKESAEGLSKHTASRWIERLKELPREHAAKQATGGAVQTIKSEVPQGRYAVTGDDGSTDFYRVDRPTEGKWAGYIFVKLGLGGPHGEPRWERIPLRNVQTILNKIEKDGPKEAMLRYGKELGHCGHCGRTLTNPESIEAGIGPVCRGKMGW